ncbi:hypothetical protein [Nocardia terpenica]|uniref:hypothetical protein n=1 Tax=Nocardia terpenica TaxID=455432 RepID=UPI0002E8BB89|nr:hypothetical protein [Nocardia terpenica]NQE86708.1 hypothetical protein [Nocardia terpenica]
MSTSDDDREAEYRRTRDEFRNATDIWIWHGKPQHGPIHTRMIRARQAYLDARAANDSNPDALEQPRRPLGDG